MTPEILIRMAIALGFFAFGWTLFRFGLRAAGFCLGYVFGTSVYELLVTWLVKLNELHLVEDQWLQYLPQHPLAALVAGCVFGVVGIIMAQKMYQVLIFLGGTAGGLYVLYTDESQRALVEKLFAWLGILQPIDNLLGNAWPAVLAILIGLLFLLFQKKLIVVLTACAGAYMISDIVKIPILFLPLCFIGYLLQTIKRPSSKKAEE